MHDIWNYLIDHPVTLFIVGGEIAFWLVLVAGLVLRYPMRLRRTSTVLLASVPLIDLTVLVATVVDLAHGAVPNPAHGLAAVYLGFSIVFGPAMVRWADVRFAHRFAGGPPPAPKPQGRARVRYEWREWGKCVLASVIAAALLLAAIAFIGRPGEMGPLWVWLGRLGGLVGIWLVAGPVWQEFSRDGGKRAEQR